MIEGSARSSGRLLAGVIQPKEIDGVLPCRRFDLGHGGAAKRRDSLNGLDEIARSVRRPTPALWRQERRIGLHQHVVQRDDTGRTDDAVGGRVRHRPGEGDVKASGQRFGGDRGVSAEAVKDTLQAGKFIKDRDQVGECVPSMQHDRLADFLRQAQHLTKGPGLVCCRRPVVPREVVVEPDLAYRHHARVRGQLSQLSTFIGADRFARRVRMPPDCRPQPRNLLRQLDTRPVIRAIVSDIDNRLHAGGSRPFQRLRGRQRRAQVQEVGVRIDQATGSGFSIRGKRTPPRVVWVRGANRPHSRAVTQDALGSALTCAAILVAVSGMNGVIR